MTDPPDLAPTRFLDADHPAIGAFVRRSVGDASDPRERACRLFAAVRDEVRYSVRVDFSDPDGYRASATLTRGRGFCVQKAVLLAAALRCAGIAARLHFADLRNRLAPEALREQMRTDLFAYHCFAEVLLDGRWLKATPSFDRDTCARQGMALVTFDGRSDALLPLRRADGTLQFEYLADHGTFDDLPFATVLDSFRRTYPHLDPSASLRHLEE